MLKPMSALVVIAITATLSQSTATAQMHMTNLPWRIEEVLVNPDLGSVLRESRGNQSMSSPSRLQEPPRSNSSSSLARHRNPANSTSNNHYRPPTARVADRSNDASFSVRTPGDEGSAPEATKRSNFSPSKNDDQKPNNLPNQNPLSEKQLRELEKLNVQVTGATAMVASQAANLTVEVTNPTNTNLGPVDVNIQVPDAITITRFDRDAWLDDERRIVAFRLEELAPGQTQTIRLRGISHNPGKTDLRVMLTSGTQMITGKKFNTQVFPQQLAKKYSFGDTKPETTQK